MLSLHLPSRYRLDLCIMMTWACSCELSLLVVLLCFVSACDNVYLQQLTTSWVCSSYASITYTCVAYCCLPSRYKIQAQSGPVEKHEKGDGQNGGWLRSHVEATTCETLPCLCGQPNCASFDSFEETCTSLYLTLCLPSQAKITRYQTTAGYQTTGRGAPSLSAASATATPATRAAARRPRTRSCHVQNSEADKGTRTGITLRTIP